MRQAFDDLIEEANACISFKKDSFFASKRQAIGRRARQKRKLLEDEEHHMPDDFMNALGAVFDYADIDIALVAS
jgi:hypothetical protein